MFGVTILGNNSALPAFERHPTAQIITLDDCIMLVDCGEGTQLQLSRYRIRWGRIQSIFISHLHGDHYFGLPGLLNSMSLLNRTTDLHLYSPPGLDKILDLQMKVANGHLTYSLIFHPLSEAEELLKTDRLKVSCFPTQHRIPCYGFRFEQVRAPRKVIPEKAIQKGIPAAFYEQLKKGEDYLTKEGLRIANAEVTEKGVPPKSYAFGADTLYFDGMADFVRDVDLLYHETTYLQKDQERAAQRFHSTTEQAATLAQQAGAGRLLIGHFSSKYEFLEDFETEARTIFPNTDLALEGVTYRV